MNMKIWYLKTRENEIKYHIFYKGKRLQIKKSSHMKGRERMKNCIWLLQKSAKACPQRLVYHAASDAVRCRECCEHHFVL